jgi:hypothetical protein
MPRSAPRARKRRTPKKTVQTNFKRANSRTRNDRPAQPAGDRIARLLESPLLIRVVPHLPAETLQALIRHRGLDAAGDLVAAATPAQLTAIFDIDLWRRSGTGRDDRFDDDRFGEWLEALVESDVLLAARTIAALDGHLVVNGMSRYVRVFDPAALAMPSADDAMPDDGTVVSEPSREVGGYVVRARRTDAWDAIVALLFALADHHPDCFHVVMCGCRRLSNSTPEIDGLDDLLTEPDQMSYDAAAERDHRRSQLGYMTAADARAFLQMARQRHRHTAAMQFPNPIAAAFRRTSADGVQTVERDQEQSAVKMGRQETRESVEAVLALLEDAGLMAGRPRPLLPAAEGESPRQTPLEALLQQISDSDEFAFADRTRELAFLANALMTGGSVLSRAFTPREASDAAVAICNLGLEHWPAPGRFGPHDDLVAAFEIGWAELHAVSMFVVRQLIDALSAVQSVDDEIQDGLQSLGLVLVRSHENRTPWLARSSLDVIAMIDMPVCVSLQALLDECPVLPDALTAILERRTGAIDPMAFEFISTGQQIQKVRDFAGSLLEALMR